MPEHVRYEDDDLFNKETHHESSDVPIRPLFIFIAIFIAFAFFTHAVVLFMYKGLAKFERNRAEAPFTAVAQPADEKIPQQPRLQPFPRADKGGEVMPPNTNTPVVDLIDMRRTEDQALHNYGWVDKEKGVVRLPIEVAKDLAVQRLNAPAAPVATTTAPSTTTAPAETTTAPAAPTTTGGQP